MTHHFLARPARRAALAAALAAAGVLAAPSVAAAQPPRQAEVVASASYPGHGFATTATSHDGRIQLLLTWAGLTKYDVGPKSVVRRGTTRVKGIEAPNSELLLHRDNRIAYVVEEHRSQAVVQVYDITGRTPRLVRTLDLVSQVPEGKKRYFYDAALTSDGRRLLLLGPSFVQVLGLGNPARPTGGVQFPSVFHGSTLALTPDSKNLLVGYGTDTEPRLARYLLPRTGPATLETSAPVVVPGWEDRQGRTWISRLLPQRGSRSVFAEVQSFADEGGDSGLVKSGIVRVRLSDFKVKGAAVPGDTARQLFLEAVSNDGGRVYGTAGYTTDEPELRPRAFRYLPSPTLGLQQTLSGLGDVRALSVSPGGATRGRLFVAAVRGDKHVLLQVDPS